MSKVCPLLVGVSLCVGVAAASGQTAAAPQTAPDATIADPNVHQVGFENEHIRVITAMASPGTKSPMHSHPPLLVVSIGTGRAQVSLPDGKTQILDLRPGSFFWIDGAQHSWELLAGEINVVAVEVKAAKAAKTK